jgi:hypothetical protein
VGRRGGALSLGEKSQVQAWDRTADATDATGPARAPDPDDLRHGATTLFVALKVATGKITNACYPRHRHQEFLRLLKQVTNGLSSPQVAHRAG